MREIEEIRNRLCDLESLLERLNEERADIDHRARRLGDGLERAGGHDPLLAPDLEGLAGQRKANSAARDRAAAEVAALRGRLAELGN